MLSNEDKHGIMGFMKRFSACKEQGSVKFGKQMLPCVLSLWWTIGWNGGREAALPEKKTSLD